VFLGEARRECRREIGLASAEHIDFQESLRIGVDRRIEPFFSPSTDWLLVDGDPRQRVGSLLTHTMIPSKYRLMLAVDAEAFEGCGGLPQRNARWVEPHRERPESSRCSHRPSTQEKASQRSLYAVLGSSITPTRNCSFLIRQYSCEILSTHREH